MIVRELADILLDVVNSVQHRPKAARHRSELLGLGNSARAVQDLTESGRSLVGIAALFGSRSTTMGKLQPMLLQVVHVRLGIGRARGGA